MSGFEAPGEVNTVWMVVGYDYEEHIYDSVWDSLEDAKQRLKTVSDIRRARRFYWEIEKFELGRVYDWSVRR